MINNFLRPLAVSLCLIGLPCLAGELATGDDVIGSYTLSVDGEVSELHSNANAIDDFSDLTFVDGSGVKTYHILGSNNDDFPRFDVTIQEGGAAGDLSIVSVTFLDTDYDTALAAAHNEAAGASLESLGVIMGENIDFGGDGAIRFAFSAALVRIDLETERPVAGEVGVHVDVSFSGTFPAYEKSD